MNQYSYLSFSTIIIFKKMLEFILKFLLYPYRERERDKYYLLACTCKNMPKNKII